MGLSDAAAWFATVLTPATAGVGWILRRWGSGRYVARMRPHLILGYAVPALALIHVMLSMGNASSANGTGILFGSLALFGLALQAFSGTNLQSPGSYRLPLRRWHTALFWSIAALAVGHIVLNA